MDTENTTDERNQSISKGTITTKLRMKDRSRSQTTPTSTDINDPENLDYEDIDDNHSPGKLEDNHELEQINNPVKQINDETKTSINIQDEEDKPLNKPQEINNNNNNNTSSSMIDNSAAASDEGEVDEADLEDGEIHDPSTSKNRTPFTDDQTSEQNRNRINTNISSSPQAKVHCRFFLQGRCHWGPNCKFIHPNNDSTKNSSGPSIDALSSINNEISPPVPTGIPIPQTTTNNAWISPQATTTTSQFFPNPVLRGATQPSGIPLVVPPTGTESAWERGLRSAKTLREQSMRRKQQDKDFNDKKFNLTIRDAQDDKDGDDNILNIDRPSSIDYDLNNLPGSNYADQRTYSDRYHPYMYTGSSGNSHYNNNHHRNNNNNARNNNNNNNNNHNNNTSSTNDHSDRRLRHSDDYAETRNDNRIRKENSSTKHSKSTSKKDDSSSSSYKRNLSQQQYTSGSHHNNDTQLHFNPYSSRRGDDWQDPWDRSRNHGSGNHRSSGGGRERSYSSSSSATSSSTSRSSHSRSHSTSSSSRSRSRSRSRPKRRSPSVTRATKPTTTTKSSEMVKNGNEKKSNSNKKLVSPTTTTTAAANKFLPGRQISSHTLKKAEKSSNTSNSMVNNHSKDQHGKDSDINIKKQIRKENPSRSDSTSSSSSSDSDTNRITHRSSSTSSESSSSENDMRTSTKTKTASGGGKTTVGSTSSSSHTTKTINRQLSSSSGGGSKNTNTKSKNDSINRESSKTKESSLTSAKKRRDTSSSTGSASTTKKTKLNIDSHKSSTDANNAENSDSCKKKEKQKILKKLQEVEKLINQRSTKTSS